MVIKLDAAISAKCVKVIIDGIHDDSIEQTATGAVWCNGGLIGRSRFLANAII